ncbi:SDR family oxidoreductase [Streptomyces sp. NPDC047197]|uniref:SDR family NAD(P)-dependent oxidoreductase n=1 Tax=Streptomyces sp. NPDC047197 TaxID=3155477 RepID=UPI0033C2CF08
MNERTGTAGKALVLGSSRGIGRAVARRLHVDGHQLIVHGQAPGSALEQTARELNAPAVCFDVSLAEQSRRGLDRLVEVHGVPRTLVYCAGVNVTVPFEQATPEQVTGALGVNFLGAVWTYQRLLPLMADQPGSCVVTVSSIRGLDPTAGDRSPFYSAAKAALNNLTTALAKRYAPRVRINAVAPGFTLTDMAQTWHTATRQQAHSGLLGRPAEADEIAAPVAFLAGPDASYITGQTLTVDGGYTLCGK